MPKAGSGTLDFVHGGREYESIHTMIMMPYSPHLKKLLTSFYIFLTCLFLFFVPVLFFHYSKYELIFVFSVGEIGLKKIFKTCFCKEYKIVIIHIFNNQCKFWNIWWLELLTLLIATLTQFFDCITNTIIILLPYYFYFICLVFIVFRKHLKLGSDYG